MNINGKKLSPFVKWVGGKRQVIDKYLYKYFPIDFKNYIEPFVGGGAVLFYLQPSKAIINDFNFELITTYEVIKNDVKNLIKKLDIYHQQHSKEFYLKLRKEKLTNTLDIAARFIYLNKSGYNGLYRVNSKNEFNVPFGNKPKEKLKLYDKENLLSLSKYFNNNQILFFNDDFEKAIDKAKKGDFVFCDPPYDYEDNKNGFVTYTDKGFDKKEQIRLSNKLKQLDKKGIKWMLTNHNTKLINDLYKDFHIVPIITNRNVNSKGDGRKNQGDEVIIMNYQNKLSNFFETLEITNIELKDLVDINKILKDIDEVEMSLYSLDYIIDISEEKINNKIRKLYEKNKNVFKVLPLLIACDEKKELKINFQVIKLNKLINDIELIVLFFKQSGLLNLILKGKIKHFLDYLTGVKVGLDSNSRKNRFGNKNEKDIQYIIENELKKYSNLEIKYQISKLEDFKDSNILFNKKFDVMIKNKINNKIVLIESSYYNTTGSKLSETSRSYTKIHNEIAKYYNQYKFIWIVDGNGIKSIKNEIEEKIKLNYVFNKSNFLEYIKEILDI